MSKTRVFRRGTAIEKNVDRLKKALKEILELLEIPYPEGGGGHYDDIYKAYKIAQGALGK